MSADDMTPELAVEVLRREVVRLRGGAGGYGGRSREALTLAHAIETLLDVRAQATTGDRHDELYAKAREAIDMGASEGVLRMGEFGEPDELGEVLAWLAQAADALRLQRRGHHDRELLEFVQNERDEAKARAAQAEQATAERICAWLRSFDDKECMAAAEFIETGGWKAHPTAAQVVLHKGITGGLWLGIAYTDGTRVSHAFTEATLYTVDGRVHVCGEALCRVQFTNDRSGARTDLGAVAIGPRRLTRDP